jgi:sulfate permease, SulP family
VSIVIGFTNGIAVLIALSQVKDFLGLDIDRMPADFFHQIGRLGGALHTINPYAVAIGAASLALVVLWPKSYLMSTTVPMAALDRASARNHRRAGAGDDRGRGIQPAGGNHRQQVRRHPAGTAVLRAAGFQLGPGQAAGGADHHDRAAGRDRKSLLCARVADNMIDDRHDPNQELMAQGAANFVVPFFGGIPATGTVARTVTNMKSGAASPVAGIVHA